MFSSTKHVIKVYVDCVIIIRKRTFAQAFSDGMNMILLGLRYLRSVCRHHILDDETPCSKFYDNDSYQTRKTVNKDTNLDYIIHHVNSGHIKCGAIANAIF